MSDLLPGILRYLFTKSIFFVFVLSLGVFLRDPAISVQALFCSRWTYIFCSLYLVTSLLHRRFVPHKRSDVYSLDHGMLNLQLPVRHMWMNLGYWDTKSFPDACQSLLREVLLQAGLIQLDEAQAYVLKRPESDTVTLLDLGFGCGDQSMVLTQHYKTSNSTSERPMVDRYVGVTNNEAQRNFAKRSLDTQRRADDPGSKAPLVSVFCEDAANPQTWSDGLLKDVRRWPSSPPHRKEIRWVLALDSLCHFSPSRELIFQYANKELDSSLMAFDLVLCDNPSRIQLCLLWIIGHMTQIPFGNFITEAEYVRQLSRAGYTEADMEIRDISDHVFLGISDFISRRDRELREIGVSSFTKFNVAGRVFRWWGETGVLRGCIVVARKTGKASP